jgi:Domain of unknown function (DUF4372)
MAFAQLTFRESLRDIEDCLAARPDQLVPSGLPQPGLSQYVGRCQRRARRLYAGQPLEVELQQSVYALDSTTIELCLNLFRWARFGSTKAAIKLHTLLDLRGPIPSFIEITDGALPRRPRPGGAGGRAGRLLRHGSWLPRLCPPSYPPSSRCLLYHPCPERSALRTLCFPADRCRHRPVQRPPRTTSGLVLAQGFPRQTARGATTPYRIVTSVSSATIYCCRR